MLFNRAIRALWLLVVPFSPVAKGQQQPELDITKVGLRPRSEVIKVLGPPSSVAAEDQDGYAWGLSDTRTEGWTRSIINSRRGPPVWDKLWRRWGCRKRRLHMKLPCPTIGTRPQGRWSAVVSRWTTL